LQNVLIIASFAFLYWIADRADFLEQKWPEKFVATRSSVHLTEGDLYGTCAPIEDLRQLNTAIGPILATLKQTPYFRTYKVNLERECPLWAQERFCGNEQCAVCECEEKDVPDFWKDAKES
jgi:ERO1-like protein alpha